MSVIKRIVIVVGAVALIAALHPIYITGIAFGVWQPLSRPVGVSAKARYVETLKSAGWFECSVDRLKDVNVCRAWDRDGKLVAFGNYRLDGENRAATLIELRPSTVESYPDHPNLAWIYLFDAHNTIMGRTLVPVNEAGQPLQRFEVRLGTDTR
jgi:hypothetical protein